MTRDSRSGSAPRKRPRAVALRYEGHGAPRVTAKGEGAVAERILAAARRHQVPLHEDPALAAALAAVPLGEEIPPALYAAVAEVLAFVLFVHGRGPIPPPPGADARHDGHPQGGTPPQPARTGAGPWQGKGWTVAGPTAGPGSGSDGETGPV